MNEMKNFNIEDTLTVQMYNIIELESAVKEAGGTFVLLLDKPLHEVLSTFARNGIRINTFQHNTGD